MFETITVGVIHKIYIIYVAFDIKENPKLALRLKYIRKMVASHSARPTTQNVFIKETRKFGH